MLYSICDGENCDVIALLCCRLEGLVVPRRLELSLQNSSGLSLHTDVGQRLQVDGSFDAAVADGAFHPPVVCTSSL